VAAPPEERAKDVDVPLPVGIVEDVEQPRIDDGVEPAGSEGIERVTTGDVAAFVVRALEDETTGRMGIAE
jgi:hypothetical protein